MRVATSLFACSATIGIAHRVEESLGRLVAEEETEAELDSEYWLNCKALPFPGHFQFSRLEQAGEDTLSKYLPITARGMPVIFQQADGDWKIDTAAVQKGAGLRYRSDKDGTMDPQGQAEEDGAVVSGKQLGEWLQVDSIIPSYAAKGVLALELTDDAKLEAHAGSLWRYELLGKTKKARAKADLTWELEGVKMVDESIDLNNIKFVKRVWNRPAEHDELTKKHTFDPEPATVEIHYDNGNMDSLYGGVYYNHEIMKLSMLQSSFEKFDSGVAGSVKKKESMSPKKDPNDPKEPDPLTKVKDKCIGWEWCVGFTYNPALPARTTVYYLSSWGDGPVGKSSAQTSTVFNEKKNPTELKSWVSYKYAPTDSEGVVLNPLLNLGKYWEKINGMQDGIMAKKVNFSRTMPLHPVDGANLHDFTMGTGEISVAISEAGEKLPAPERVSETDHRVPRENWVKTMGYRMYMMIGSEALYAQLKCVGMKACGDGDLMVPKAKKCPKKGEIEKGPSPM